MVARQRRTNQKSTRTATKVNCIIHRITLNNARDHFERVSQSSYQKKVHSLLFLISFTGHHSLVAHGTQRCSVQTNNVVFAIVLLLCLCVLCPPERTKYDRRTQADQRR